MWFLVFILQISIGALLCCDCFQECFSKQFKQKCGDHPENVTYPETADDLLNFCKPRVAMFSCNLQVEEQCGKDIEDVQRRALNFLETVCDKENPTFKVISDNLKCMKEYYNYVHLCDQKFDPIEDHKTRISEEDEKAEKCLSDLIQIRCAPMLIGYICNSDEIKKVIKKVVEFDGRYLEKCTWVNLEKLNPILEEYDAIFLDEVRSYEKGRGL